MTSFRGLRGSILATLALLAGSSFAAGYQIIELPVKLNSKWLNFDIIPRALGNDGRTLIGVEVNPTTKIHVVNQMCAADGQSCKRMDLNGTGVELEAASKNLKYFAGDIPSNDWPDDDRPTVRWTKKGGVEPLFEGGIVESINANGVFVGPTRGEYKPYRFAAELEPLATPCGGSAWPLAINDTGVIVGWGRSCLGYPRPVKWDVDGSLTVLQDDFLNLPDYTAFAVAITADGRIYGQSTFGFPPAFEHHAVRFENGTAVKLGALPGDTYSYVYDVNNAGVGVGQSGFSVVISDGNGGVTALSDLLSPEDLAKYKVDNLRFINDAGQLLGKAKRLQDDEWVAVRLDPRP